MDAAAIQDTALMGKRYIGCGAENGRIEMVCTPGNALGAYLDGADLIVHGNAQDATGDTMNAGRIIIHGNTGDAAGYAMRGGEIFVKGNAGYRAGIHMKEYKEKVPVIVIGGHAGNFLGEYQAGGIIIVFGIGCGDRTPVGRFTGTGMHGGVMYLRTQKLPDDLPSQITVSEAGEADREKIASLSRAYCGYFGGSADELISSHFYVLRPNTANPYKQLYVYN